MANVKNFGLIGVGSDLQFGKAGTRLVNNTGVFNFKAADGSTDVALTSAGITSSSGGVTLTTGNLVLSSSAGVVSIGGDNMLQAATGGYPQLSGSASVLIPTGNTASRPGSAVAGMMRVNNDTPLVSYVEYFDGTVWSSVANTTLVGDLQTEVNNIESSLGSMINDDGTYNSSGLVNATIWPTPTTDLTSALNTLAAAVNTDNSLDEIFPSTAIGNVIYANGSNVWAQAVPGATSGVQAYSAKLASLASNITNGVIVQDSSGTVTARTLTSTNTNIVITNGSGVSGNPSFDLGSNLLSIGGLTGTGFVTQIATDTFAERSMTGTAGRIVVTDGDGVATSPTFDLATVSQASSGNFVKVTLDGYGRVTGNTAVVTADITALVDSEYLRLDGTSTMTGALNMGSQLISNVAEPVSAQDAATKNYVDNAVAGLTWKDAVEAFGATNVPLTGGTTLTIDGYSVQNGNRVLLTGQTTATENGIYVASGVGTAYTLTRSADATTPAELAGAAVFVTKGAVYANSGWTQTVDPLASFDLQNWAQFSGSGAYTGSGAINITGNVISVVTGDGITQGSSLSLNIGSGTALSDTGGPLVVVLDTTATGGLSQTGGALRVKAGGVTNAMLASSLITLDADTGTGGVDLGNTLHINGTAAQGIVTSVSGTDPSTFVITADNATTGGQKGVSSFDSVSFTATAGNITLNTVDTAHGGTGLTSFVTNEVFYAGSTSTVDQSANFTFDGTSTLALGGALPLSFSGAAGSITATATNSDLILMPNGTGSVIVGPVGAGLIQSDAGTALTVRGNTGLTISAGTAGVTVVIATGTSSANKVTVSGPTASDYATNLGASDLTNKQYVDDAIISGAASGAIKAVKVALSGNGTTNIGAAMPANATVLSVKVQVLTGDATATLSVGKTGSVAAYMTTAENDPATTGLYLAETYVTEGSSEQVIATVAASTGTPTFNVIVEYQVA